ncbi:MAG: hypothetical protein WA667_19900 [Candidatus Nitrosopolaris sp.]
MEKMMRIFLSIRSLPDTMGKGCVSCGKIATREALFDVGAELILIERYCDICMIKFN